MSDLAWVEWIDHPTCDFCVSSVDALRREVTVTGRVYGLLDLYITKDQVYALYAYIEDAA